MTDKQEARNAILASIAARGWFTLGMYNKVAQELEAEGLIKWGVKYFPGGNRKLVWVAA